MIGDRIQALRERRGMTQSELATAMSININTLASYERNLREPKIETILDFAKYFAVSTDYLLDYVSDIEADSESELPLSQYSSDAITNIYHKLKNFASEYELYNSNHPGLRQYGILIHLYSLIDNSINAYNEVLDSLIQDEDLSTIITSYRKITRDNDYSLDLFQDLARQLKNRGRNG
ncbi:MAG: helix-turn-helix transcriptional regulator [Clostridiales bacterium]|nr:helix-turn-helix transcriptional regulator [Clostridiales bacterium]